MVTPKNTQKTSQEMAQNVSDFFLKHLSFMKLVCNTPTDLGLSEKSNFVEFLQKNPRHYQTLKIMTESLSGHFSPEQAECYLDAIRTGRILISNSAQGFYGKTATLKAILLQCPAAASYLDQMRPKLRVIAQAWAELVRFSEISQRLAYRISLPKGRMVELRNSDRGSDRGSEPDACSSGMGCSACF